MDPGARRRRRIAVTAAVVLLGLALSGPSGGGAMTGVRSAEDEPAAVTRPNIVFFLADDMTAAHLRHLPSVRKLIFDQGARFTNYYTNISLCCPSRVTMLTGSYAHNTEILGNLYPDGFHGFHVGMEADRSVAITLQRDAGYDTALLGKYLNEYPFVASRPEFGVRPTFVPPGWTDWAVPVEGLFAGTNYDLNLNGRIVHKQARRDYLGDLLNRRAVSLIRGNEDGEGLALFLSYFAPHGPEPASPIEKDNDALVERISRLRVPRTPDFNERNVRDKPPHMRRLPRIDPRTVRGLDRIYRRQVLSLASIDRYVRVVVRELRRTGQLDNTYLVFTSDNGLHLGHHRMFNVKNFAYEKDSHMPFAIRGPGIEPGTVVGQVTGNIDLAPTLADIAGHALGFPHDGESLLPLAEGLAPKWRNYYFVTRGLPFSGTARPDKVPRTPARRQVQPPGLVRYSAVISARWQYIRWATGDEELYDGARDPYQVRNVLARPPEDRTELEQRALEEHRVALSRLRGCAGPEECRVQ